MSCSASCHLLTGKPVIRVECSTGEELIGADDEPNGSHAVRAHAAGLTWPIRRRDGPV